MKIKQQKQIKAFLIQELGNEKGSEVFDQQEKILDELIKTTKDKSQNQMQTLIQTILSRIALYKALSSGDFQKEDVFRIMRKYMIDVVAAQKHSATVKQEMIPGFYYIYRNIFLKVLRTTDLWESTQSCTKDSFDAAITKCLWHTACVENGCAELCPLFCDVDDVNYGGLKKMGFKRTKTLGYGGDCCDFHFYKK